MGKKLFFLMMMTLFLGGCSTDVSNKKGLSDLTEITLETLDDKIEKQETMVVYFGWIENCGDSLNFQENYLIPELNKENVKLSKMLIVNLDKELPEALEKKELRKPLFEKYGVQYSPTLVYYIDGEVEELIEWTALTSDPTYAISKDLLDQFFQNIK